MTRLQIKILNEDLQDPQEPFGDKDFDDLDHFTDHQKFCN